MKLKLLFLLILLAVVYITKGETLQVLPGLDYLSGGFDIVTTEIHAAPIFSYTFIQNKTWFNPQQAQFQYSVPDQVSVKNQPFIAEQCTTSVYSSSEEVEKAYMQKYNIQENFFRVGMAMESKIAFVARETFNSEQFFGDAQIYVTCYETDLVTFPLDPIFNQTISNLPLEITNENELNQYYSFIKQYGTHYLSRIIFGGTANMETKMNIEIYNTYSTNEILQQLSGEFFYLSSSFTSVSGATEVSQYFQENSISNIILSGGNTSSYLPSEWQSWVHTVYYDPIPVNAVINEISRLAPNQQIEINLENVIAVYINQSAEIYCDLNLCNGHGKCNNNNNEGGCTCDEGWYGDYCGFANCKNYTNIVWESGENVDFCLKLAPNNALICDPDSPVANIWCKTQGYLFAREYGTANFSSSQYTDGSKCPGPCTAFSYILCCDSDYSYTSPPYYYR